MDNKKTNRCSDLSYFVQLINIFRKCMISQRHDSILNLIRLNGSPY